MTRKINRRTMLRGLGAAVSLPALDVMLPRAAYAAGEVKGPKRYAFVLIPNGVNIENWTPKQTGDKFELTPILQPLQKIRDQVTVISGLMHDKGRANGDGAGDHARSAASFLTGAQPYKTNGANIKAGISVDQVLANKIGQQTRFPSLELGCERGAMSGNCDSGYSCAYSHAISWKGESQPLTKEIDPRLAFDRLFGGDDPNLSAENRAKRDLYRKSILDFVLDDAQQLRKQLGQTDQRKLDEYLTSVREVEKRIERAATKIDSQIKSKRPTGIPSEYADHLRLMGDILVLAFQTDSTRVATFMFANEGSGRSYPFIDVPEGHHDLSHHGRNADKLAKIKKINEFHMRQFAYLLERMHSVREGERTLLENSLVIYGSGISDGDRHNHEDLPILVAGTGGGMLKPNRHLKFSHDTPVCNLFVSMLNHAGVSTERFGDSTGRLKV